MMEPADDQASPRRPGDDNGGETRCRICGSSDLTVFVKGVRDYEYGAPGAYRYLHCSKCQLLNIDPSPSQEVLGLAYPDEYHAYAAPKNFLGRIMKRAYWRSKAKICAETVKLSGRVLDVGCAHGDFLEEMKSLGFSDLWGVEFNEEIAQKARARGFNVKSGELEAVNLPPASFDVIAMTNFIEHVEDPVATLELCRRLLKSDGLVLGETPSYECWDRRLFGRFWGGYHTPRHLTLFSSGSLARIADKAGFASSEIENLLQPAHWALSIQNKMMDAGIIGSLRYGRTRGYPLMLMMFLLPNLIQNWFSAASSVSFLFRRD